MDRNLEAECSSILKNDLGCWWHHANIRRTINRSVSRASKNIGPTIVLNQQIVGVERLADASFILTAATGEKHHSKTIISGYRDFNNG